MTNECIFFVQLLFSLILFSDSTIQFYYEVTNFGIVEKVASGAGLRSVRASCWYDVGMVFGRILEHVSADPKVSGVNLGPIRHHSSFCVHFGIIPDRFDSPIFP